GVLPSLAALVTAGTAELVCFSIQHGVQRLFHRATRHLAKMIANPRFIDLDHLTHRLLVTHLLLLQCMKKLSILKVRKIPDVIVNLIPNDILKHLRQSLPTETVCCLAELTLISIRSA